LIKIRIVSVGKLKEKYWLAAQQEYVKRLSRFAAVEILELKDEPTTERPTPKERGAVLKKEAERIYKAIAGFDVVAILAMEAKERTSEEFSAAISDCFDRGQSMCFVIGGSLGLAEEIKQQGDISISLSRLTFPHRLARILLLEQLFRACKIRANEEYHK